MSGLPFKMGFISRWVAASALITLLAVPRSVMAGEPPKRIVSTCLACDEIILGVLKQAGQTNRLIAVSRIAEDLRYSNIRGDLSPIPGRAGSEIEHIIGLRPDIVFITEFNRPEFRAALQKANVPTFPLGPFNNMRDILAAIEATGAALDEPEAARFIKNQMLAAIEDIRLRTPKNVRSDPRRSPALLGFAPDGTIAGANTPFDSIVRAAGGVNEAVRHSMSGWQRVGAEKIATFSPDWIVTSGLESERSSAIAAVKKAPGWKSLKAVREGRIIYVPSALLLATSHHVVGAIDLINRAMFSPALQNSAAPAHSAPPKVPEPPKGSTLK